ncbi:MAG: diacylglycerol kinase family protein [Christensenellales bacterium]
MIKHHFIVNPTAGLHSAEGEVAQKLAAFQDRQETCLYVTRGPGDASDFVRKTCLMEAGPLRFYACGGDGTLNEVVNGAWGFPQAAVGCYPCGSGNDYVKYYGGKEAFLDLSRQFLGEESPVDLMRMGDRLAINMVHFGFDSLVTQTMQRIRRMPLIGGKNAYYTGVLSAFFKPFANPCKVWVDGQALNDHTLLLCTVACGQFVGGGFRCAPRSDNQDGLMDVCLCLPVSRPKFVSLIKSYTLGTHLDDPRFKKVLAYRRGHQITLQMERDFPVSMDGELIRGQNFEINLLPQALRFVVPSGAQPIKPVGLTG